MVAKEVETICRSDSSLSTRADQMPFIDRDRIVDSWVRIPTPRPKFVPAKTPANSISITAFTQLPLPMRKVIHSWMLPSIGGNRASGH